MFPRKLKIFKNTQALVYRYQTCENTKLTVEKQVEAKSGVRATPKIL